MPAGVPLTAAAGRRLRQLRRHAPTQELLFPFDAICLRCGRSLLPYSASASAMSSPPPIQTAAHFRMSGSTANSNSSHLPSSASSPLSIAPSVHFRVQLGARSVHSDRVLSHPPTAHPLPPPSPHGPPLPPPAALRAPSSWSGHRPVPRVSSLSTLGPPSPPHAAAEGSRRPPPPVSPPLSSPRAAAPGPAGGGRLTPRLLALLAAAVLLCGYEWYRWQLQDEHDEWVRQHESEQQQRRRVRADTAVALTAVSPSAQSARPSAPAWCDSVAKVELWKLSERLDAVVQRVAPPSLGPAILTPHNNPRHVIGEQTASTAHLNSAQATFTDLQSSLSALYSTLQSAESDKETLLSAIAVHLVPLQRSLLLLALHPLLPPSIRSLSLSLVESLSSSSPALSESFVNHGGSALIGHVAHHSPISPSLFVAYKRQLQHQQDAFHQQQLLDALTIQSGEDSLSARATVSTSSSLCEIDELLSVLKSMPNVHRHLHVYLHKQQQDEGAGAESTLPSLHPSLAKEDLEVLNRVPIELTSRPPAASITSAAEVLSTASNAVSSLLAAFLARYTYSYNAVQHDMAQQMERRRVDDHFHAVRLLASMCEQREVCEYLMDRGMMPLLARWYKRGGVSREMRVKVQLARAVANANSHPTSPQMADICLHSPLFLELVDWAHSDPLQSDDHFLPVNLPIPAEATDLSTAFGQDTPPPASSSFPATLPTRDSLTAQRAVDALSTFRHSAPARLHQLRQDVASSISALSSSLPPSVRSRLPSPTSSLPHPSPPITSAEAAASGDSNAVHQQQSGAKPTVTAASSPSRVGTGIDSYSSLLNVLNSQSVRALANVHSQMERAREERVNTAAERWWKQEQLRARETTSASAASDDGNSGLWDTLLSRGRASHPLYADEVYLIHPAFVPLSPPSPLASAVFSPPSLFNQSSVSSNAAFHRSPVLWYPSTPTVDIVFVHGLLGNPLRTWRLHTSHDEKVAAKDKQRTGDSGGSDEVDPTEAQLIAQYTMAQHLRDFIARRKRVPNDLESVIQSPAAAATQPAEEDEKEERPEEQKHTHTKLQRPDGAVSSKTEEGQDEEAGEDEEERDAQLSDAEIIWPRDWLPSALPENARVLSIGFRSSLLHEQDSTGNSLVDRADQFIHKLDVASIPASAHPPSASTPNVVWITHSMGGLLAKQMLYASPALLASTLGLVFLATPHAGAWLPKNSTTRALFGFIATPSIELEQLEENSPHLLTLNEHIRLHLAKQDEQQRLRVLSLGEGQPTPLPPNRPSSPFSLLLVPSKSSNPGYGEWQQLDDENHLNICKPRDKHSAVFRSIVAFVAERMDAMHRMHAQHSDTAQQGAATHTAVPVRGEDR